MRCPVQGSLTTPNPSPLTCIQISKGLHQYLREVKQEGTGPDLILLYIPGPHPRNWRWQEHLLFSATGQRTLSYQSQSKETKSFPSPKAAVFPDSHIGQAPNLRVSKFITVFYLVILQDFSLSFQEPLEGVPHRKTETSHCSEDGGSPRKPDLPSRNPADQ